MTIAYLNAEDAIRNAESVSDTCMTAEAPWGWQEACKRLSAVNPGQWWPRESGLTWKLGSLVLYVNEVGVMYDVRQSRACLELLGIDPVWTIGGNARLLLRWIGPSEGLNRNAEKMLAGAGIGYHDCIPGEYPYAQYYDVSSCYFRLLQRLPTLRLLLAGDKLLRKPLRPSEAAKWRDLLEAVERVKLLRNSLWGAALGSLEPIPFYAKGEQQWKSSYGGPFRTAGILVGVSAWELCREASIEAHSVYSMTDSVVSPDRSRPRSWDAVGLPVRVDASGEAHVCMRGIYRVGKKETYYYKMGSRLVEAAERPATPRRLWYPEWL
jgi:hypothetical protein